MPVNVGASDNVGVTKVELRVNGGLIGTDTSGPYAFSWDSTKVANGTANLVATAYDAAGNTGQSVIVSVNVSNATVAPGDTTAPTASIAAPLGGSTVSGTVPVSVSAADNVAVTKVELRANGSLIATDTASPYSFSWDSTKVANGTANLAATAYDAAGNVGSSITVAVTVSNSAGTGGTSVDTVAPSASIVNPADGARASGNVGIEALASDNNGIAGVTMSLRINGSTVASTSGSSKLKYGWQTRNAKSGANVIELVARDAAGNTTTRSVTVYK